MNCAADKCAQGRKPCPTPSACDADAGHPLANWRDTRTVVAWISAVFVLAAAVGFGAWAAHVAGCVG
jgi:hypothetical protein